MLPRKRDTSQSHTKGPFSGPALTIMSFKVEGLSAAKEQLIVDLRQRLQVAPMLAKCICLNGSLLDQLSCTIVYLHNLFTCTFGRINMSVFLSVCLCRRMHPGDAPRARRHPAQHTRHWFGHREATLTIWQCHICYVGHHREYNITNRHQQHRDPESRPKLNLSDVSLQTTRWRFLVPPATDCGRRPTAGDHRGLQQPQFDMGLCYD